MSSNRKGTAVRKVYISGPIIGNMKVFDPEKVERNKANFAKAAEFFREWYSGWVVINPLDVPACNNADCVGPRQLEHTWNCYLRYDLLAMIRNCDTIAMLPRWQESKGARLELTVAQALDFSVRYFNNEINDLRRRALS